MTRRREPLVAGRYRRDLERHQCGRPQWEDADGARWCLACGTWTHVPAKEAKRAEKP